jgi:hypothetical protein
METLGDITGRRGSIQIVGSRSGHYFCVIVHDRSSSLSDYTIMWFVV